MPVMGINKEQKEALSKLSFDLAKVSFTTLVLGSIILFLQGKISLLIILPLGIFTTFGFVIIGHKLLQ
jgi:hypothetical protein